MILVSFLPLSIHYVHIVSITVGLVSVPSRTIGSVCWEPARDHVLVAALVTAGNPNTVS